MLHNLKLKILLFSKLKANDVKQLIKNELKDISFISLTGDGWKSNSNMPYLGTTSHFVDSRNKYRSYVLALEHREESKTAENLYGQLNGILTKWNINDKVIKLLKKLFVLVLSFKFA